MLVNCAKVLERRGRTQRAPQTRMSNVSNALDPKCCKCSLLWKAVCFRSCKFTTSLKYQEWGQPHLTCRNKTKGFRLERNRLGSCSPKLEFGLGTSLWARSCVSWGKLFISKAYQTLLIPLFTVDMLQQHSWSYKNRAGVNHRFLFFF